MDTVCLPPGAATRLALPPPPAVAGLVHHFHIEYNSAGKVLRYDEASRTAVVRGVEVGAAGR